MKDLIAIAGMPGLFKVVTNKGNGIIVEDLNDGKKQFVALRAQNNISPLETIAIYTYEDSVPLTDVLMNMEKSQKTIPIPNANDDIEDLKKYFRAILPEYNELKVKNSDIKKVVKWFSFLQTKDLLPKEEDKNAETTSSVIKDKKENTDLKKNISTKKSTPKVSNAPKAKPIMNSKKMG